MSMRVYVYDGVRDSRSWESLCPGRETIELRDGAFVRSSNSPFEARGIVVSHSMGLTDEQLSRLYDWICGRKLVMVVVSDSGSTMPSGSPRVYYRRAGVSYGYDATFAACFAKFRQALEENYDSPRWDLLEPPRWPEHLVAVYLAARAVFEEPDVLERLANKRQQWTEVFSEAQREFPDVIGKTNGLTTENAKCLAERIHEELARRAREVEHGQFS